MRAILALALAACDQPTQGLVSVRTDELVEEMMHRLVLSVEGDRRTFEKDVLPSQPWTFGVVPADGTAASVRIEAYRGEDRIAEGSGRVDFVHGARVDVSIFLACHRCADDDSDSDTDDRDPPGACEGVWDYSPSNLDPCRDDRAPSGALSLGAGTHTYDTELGTLANADGSTESFAHALLQQDDGPPLHFVALDRFELSQGGTLRVVGDHPIYIAVHGSAIIDGTIEVQAGSGAGCRGGGGQPGGDSTSADSGGGGGGGGGFGESGGSGGSGAGAAGGRGGGGGGSESGPELEPLRGGCHGGSGGGVRDATGALLASRSPGGHGGGAIQLAVRDRIEVRGAVLARGRGGGGGRVGSDITGGGAGGGAGAGGAIFFEADSIDVIGGARICAPGGSGGNGAIGSQPGADGPIEACTAGAGLDGFPGAISGGGGGGGGAEGRIRLRARMRSLRGTIVPAPSD